jgi:predicted signal transduction protein with EAL and GGDEF domain
MAAEVCARNYHGRHSTAEAATHEIHPGVGIGISVYPGNGEDAETMIRSADVAMYRAKSEGRGKYHIFRDEMNVVAREQASRLNCRGIKGEYDGRKETILTIAFGELSLYLQQK